MGKSFQVLFSKGLGLSQIAAAAEEERKRHPHRRVISLGIGDVTQPIAPVAAAALRSLEIIRSYLRILVFHNLHC